MGKRKRERSDEDIRKKIKRLEKKLTSKRKRIIIDSSDDDNSQPPAEAHDDVQAIFMSPLEEPVLSDVPVLMESVDVVTEPEPVIAVSNEVRASSSLNGDDELDEDVLVMLGEAPKECVGFGPNIHKDLAARWKDLLLKGLQKDSKDKLFAEYPTPFNCEMLNTPILNPEVKAAMIDSSIKRDASMQYRQKILGAAISAMGAALSFIISNKTLNKEKNIVKPLSDACRILCHAHYNETKIRRKLITESLNSTLRETLGETERDKSFLFGDNIGEKLKNAKNIQRSGDALKPRAVFSKNNFVQNKNTTSNLNYKTPLQKGFYRASSAAAGSRAPTSGPSHPRPYRWPHPAAPARHPAAAPPAAPAVPERTTRFRRR